MSNLSWKFGSSGTAVEAGLPTPFSRRVCAVALTGESSSPSLQLTVGVGRGGFSDVHARLGLLPGFLSLN